MSHVRRLYLRVTLKLLILVGLALAAIPFIASLQHTAHESAGNPNPWNVEIDLSTLVAGQIAIVPWPGGEVWIHYRTPRDIQYIQNIPATNLRDPISQYSDQPAALNNIFRSYRQEYFVFLPRETRRGCQVQQIELQAGISGYSEACFGGRFDSAGRIFRQGGHPDQRNLSIPQHEFIGSSRVRLLSPVN